MISPCLSYRDAHAAIDWLRRVLGAEPGVVHDTPEGRVAHAEVWLGGACVMLGDEGAGSLDVRGTSCVYFAVDDPDRRYERARTEGAEVAVELHDTPYGSRDFAVRDPEGNVWCFGTYRPG